MAELSHNPRFSKYLSIKNYGKSSKVARRRNYLRFWTVKLEWMLSSVLKDEIPPCGKIPRNEMEWDSRISSTASCIKIIILGKEASGSCFTTSN